ncbi:class I SAM-dependent methyltransferase [Nocardioides nitrophenolicus]|uniref:class I SAM-dependent methyltransferase n=1 Tax=Nocardioides nitrophenolicus TaxID=60489 RepID=UPI000A734F33|nr:class I SAM-dependent methyltransferase [Nocardioides nitrophenolicus]MBM7519381.1 SAM-dependent methyltransferase [Nocardioides nitrophenolicus]
MDYDESYYDANGQQDDRPALLLYVRLVQRYLKPTRVLDVGCGTGTLLARLSQKVPSDGYEVSAWSAARARENSPGSTVYEAGDDLPTATYDGFTAVHVFEHIPDEQLIALIEQLRKTTTPGARGFIVMPDPAGRAAAIHGPAWNALSDPTHINMKSHDEWRRFLTDQGLVVEREATDGMWNFPYSSWPKLLDGLRYGLPMAAQYLAGRMFLKPGRGESSFFVVRWA